MNTVRQSFECAIWPNTTGRQSCQSYQCVHLQVTHGCLPAFRCIPSNLKACSLHVYRHELFGVFMRNWDESDETGNQTCSVEEDQRNAKRVCKHLGIPLYEVDFVDQYWTKVFTHFVTQYGRGLTPNPDLECNRSIKFGALLKHAQGLGADRVATGHYARLTPGMHGMPMSWSSYSSYSSGTMGSYLGSMQSCSSLLICPHACLWPCSCILPLLHCFTLTVCPVGMLASSAPSALFCLLNICRLVSCLSCWDASLISPFSPVVLISFEHPLSSDLLLQNRSSRSLGGSLNHT